MRRSAPSAFSPRVRGGLLCGLARLLARAIAAWVAFAWAASATYVFASYLESHRRVPRRPLLATARGVLGELAVTALIQPLAPLFQIAGRRMGAGTGTVPVVLVHGYLQNRVDFLYLAHRLRHSDVGRIYGFNFLWAQDLRTSSAQLEKFVRGVAAEEHSPHVDVITHSTGGMLALDLLGREPALVRRAALVAVPARGVRWRGPVLGRSGRQLEAASGQRFAPPPFVSGVPVLSIHSAHDNLVNPSSVSRIDGSLVTDVDLDGPGHLSLLFDRRVADEIVRFLE